MKYLLIVLMFSLPAFSGELEKGLEAYKKGNYEDALQHWSKAAEKDDMIAQNNLGIMYSKGLGVTTNYPEAEKWFTKAANNKYAVAQYNLASFYETREQYKKAVTWYRKAAEQNYAKAQVSLADMYDQGIGVKEDNLQAVSWHQKAIENGSVASMCLIGYPLVELKRYDEAKEWVKKGFNQSKGYCEKVFKELHLQEL